MIAVENSVDPTDKVFPQGGTGMKLFRHKTKHWYFWAVNILGIALHIAVLVLIIMK